MNIIFEKIKLLDIVNTIQRAVTAKTTMPILECIKIDALSNGTVIITANNLDICIVYKTEGIVNEVGSIAISSKMFGEIIRRFPDGDVNINVDDNNNMMFLKCGSSEFNIQGLNSDEYPAIPEVDENYKFSIKQNVLKKMIRKTIFAVSVNESKKPILTGSLFEINTGVLTIVSTDGYRMAKIDSIVDSSLENSKFVIPGITLREISKVLEEKEENIDIVISKRHIKFEFDNFTVVSRILEGEYINYKPIFKSPNNIVVKVKTRDLLNSLERASLIINDDITVKTEKLPVRLVIKEDNINITCNTNRGRVNDIVAAEKLGDDIEIGFNHKYLIEALRCCESEDISMEMSNSKGACFIKEADNNEYIYMLLPVRLYD